ncbi:MAG: DUF6090 family protein [Vicinamibacterales bacterium]
MTSSQGRLWVRWLAEFALILVSVYLAVYLEGASQRRSERSAARVALTQLLGELQADIGDFDRIIAKQDSLHTDYSNLGRWLAHPASYPADSVAGALYRISSENSTLFPRRSSWTTMVAGGQLADLDAPELVLQLGQIYETIYPRIDYNSRFYDEALGNAIQGSAAIRWQSLQSTPLSQDAADVERLASSLEWVHGAWNVWYRDLLITNRRDVVDQVESLESYLGDRDGPATAPQ